MVVDRIKHRAGMKVANPQQPVGLAGGMRRGKADTMIGPAIDRQDQELAHVADARHQSFGIAFFIDKINRHTCRKVSVLFSVASA